MKTLILTLITSSLLFINLHAQDNVKIDFSEAKTTMKFDGCYLFLLVEPTNEYDHVATIKINSSIFNVNISSELEKLIKKARKKHPYFNGIVIYRDLQRANLIKFRDLELSNIGYRVGDKIVYKSGKELIYGEIKEINPHKEKVTFSHLNIYGEEKVIERKATNITPITEEQYSKYLNEQKEKIAQYKYKVGEYATWNQQKESMFGIIKFLDDNSHKATIEYIDVYGDENLKKVPYLDIITIDEAQYQKQLKEWNEEISKYKFTVGEKVNFIKNDMFQEKELISGEVVSLNDKTHTADIKYIDDKGEEKIIKKDYLKIVKVN